MRTWLNPVTRKRLARFYSMKRAVVSLRLLVGLYLLGLLAPLLCNNVPLYVRFEDRSYFPIFRFYPEDAFTGNGRMTRPDYKVLAQSSAFAEESGNKMVFPPVPFGPHESIPTASIDVEEVVTVQVKREKRVGTVDMRPDGSIRKSVASAWFFDGAEEAELKGVHVREVWPLPPAFEAAIEARFRNAAAEAISVEVAHASGRVAEISLSAYAPRQRAPKRVRLTFREVVSSTGKEIAFDVNRAGALESRAPKWWSALDEEQRQGLLAQALERFAGQVRHAFIDVEGERYRVLFETEDVVYPFRPTLRHPFGLDNSGRDVLSRIVHAMFPSLSFGLLLVTATMIVGIIIGAIQGYFGGLIDIISQRLIEVWESLPFLYILILMGSVYGRSFGLLLLCYGVFNWTGISYYMRGEFLKLRAQPFVEAAECMGLPTHRVMLKHILPNGLVPIITFFPFSLVGAIGILAALDFLGFGLPPPTPSWGELLAQAQVFRHAWWLTMFPTAALFAVMLLSVFVGEGMRRAFDPRGRAHME